MIDLAGIGALISGLTGLLVTAGTLLLQRQRRQAVDADNIEDELEIRNEQYRAALRHIRILEDDRAALTDLPPVDRPAEIRAGYFQAQAHSGRRRRAPRHAAEDDAAAAERGGGAAP